VLPELLFDFEPDLVRDLDKRALLVSFVDGDALVVFRFGSADMLFGKEVFGERRVGFSRC
jgi:hypothetical protein